MKIIDLLNLVWLQDLIVQKKNEILNFLDFLGFSS